MPFENDFKQSVIYAPPEQKLAILRPEAKQILASLHGYAALIQTLVRERGVPQMPDDFANWCDKLVQGCEFLDELISLITNDVNSLGIQEATARARMEQEQASWLHVVQSIPELKPFQSLTQAVTAVAQELALTMWIELEPELHLSTSSTAIWFRTKDNERQANLILTVFDEAGISHQHYVGYHVSLFEWSDKRNLKRSGIEGRTASLGLAVSNLTRWLVERDSIENIRQSSSWLNKEVIS